MLNLSHPYYYFSLPREESAQWLLAHLVQDLFFQYCPMGGPQANHQKLRHHNLNFKKHHKKIKLLTS